jgi:hypothetical protein
MNVPPNHVGSPEELRRQAAHVRHLASAIGHPDAARSLHDYASELDARADTLEADRRPAADKKIGRPLHVGQIKIALHFGKPPQCAAGRRRPYGRRGGPHGRVSHTPPAIAHRWGGPPQPQGWDGPCVENPSARGSRSPRDSATSGILPNLCGNHLTPVWLD